MSEHKDGGPAFPCIPTQYRYEEDGSLTPIGFNGMSLRDWFAAQALGFGFDWCNLHETGGYAEAAQVSYEIADAMLKERYK